MTDPIAEPTPEPVTDPGPRPDPANDVKALEAALKKANKEAADLRGKFQEIEDRDKTEAQKLADRAAAAEAERDTARTETLRFKVASKFKIEDEDVELFLTGTDEETLTKQAQRLAGREADRKKQGNFVAREGTTTTAAEGDDRAAARALFQSS